MEKETLNLLFLHDISEPIQGVSLSYLCRQQDEDYQITDLPIVFPGNIAEIWDSLCYDYDIIPDSFKELYQHKYKCFKKSVGNIYQIETKTYQPKKKKIK